MIGISPLFLGYVHGNIGLFDEGVGVVRIQWIHTKANAYKGLLVYFCYCILQENQEPAEYF